MKAFQDSAKQYQPLLPFFSVWDKKVREENIQQSGPYILHWFVMGTCGARFTPREVMLSTNIFSPFVNFKRKKERQGSYESEKTRKVGEFCNFISRV